MLLSVRDRLMLLNILPPEGDFITLRIVRDLKRELSFSEQEIKDLKIVSEPNVVRWDEKAEAEQGEKEVEIGSKATAIIVDVLVRLDKEKKLMEGHVSLYEKFIGKE